MMIETRGRIENEYEKYTEKDDYHVVFTVADNACSIIAWNKSRGSTCL